MSAENKLVGPMAMTTKRRWAVTFGVLMGMFLAAMEATIVGTAMAKVVASLGGLQHFSWVFSAYLVTSTVSVPIWGKLSDIYGRRPLFQIGVGVFLLGSILSGFSTSMAMLIVFRALQGLGAGALMPLAMTIIADIYTIEERARMQAVFSGVWGLASVIGPLVGGFITDNMDWAWIFWVNIPFGLASAAIIRATLREAPRTTRPTIDYAGAIVLTIAITLLMLVLVQAGEHATSMFNAVNLALLAIVVGLLVWFIRIERRATDPVIPLAMFNNRVVAVSVLACFLSGIPMFGALSFVPFFAQAALGSSATAAGSLLTPLMLSWVILSIVGGRLLLKIGFRTTVMMGLTLLIIGFALLSSFRTDMSRSWLYFDLILMGSGLGLTVLTLLLAVQQAVPRPQLGIATSLSQFARSIGGALGVAIIGMILTASFSANLNALAGKQGGVLTDDMVARFSANPNALIEKSQQTSLSEPVLAALREAMTGALHNAFWMATALSALALVSVFWLPGHGKKGDQPAPEACTPEAGERMMAAEMATFDADHEPAAVAAE